MSDFIAEMFEPNDDDEDRALKRKLTTGITQESPSARYNVALLIAREWHEACEQNRYSYPKGS